MKRSTFLAAMAGARIGMAQTIKKQTFPIGPHLQHLMFEVPISPHSPLNVISVIALMLYKAQSISIDRDIVTTTGMDEWGTARMRDLIDSYEG